LTVEGDPQAPNDKLSCRAEQAGTFRPYKVNTPIKLAPRGQLQRQVSRAPILYTYVSIGGNLPESIGLILPVSV
jgi:hypothetical protein